MYNGNSFKVGFACGTVDGRPVIKFGSDRWSVDSKHDLAVSTSVHFLHYF